MKILIVGSKGFIGSHMVAYLRGLGNRVFGCDLATGYGEVDYFQVNPSDPSFRKVFQQERFDICLNCSGAAHVGDSFADPLRDFTLNTLNVFKLLQSVKEFQPECRFVNLSSAAVYGNPASLPVQESFVRRPISPYGEHKVFAESILQEFATYYGIRCISLRIFSAFGPGLRKQLFWDLYHKMAQSDTIELHGTGAETRDFIYIDDLCQSIAMVATATEDFAIVNIANGKQVSIEHAVSVFCNAIGWKGTVRFNNMVKEGDPLIWEADITRLRSLGYRQKVSFEEGIDRYVKWANGIQ